MWPPFFETNSDIDNEANKSNADYYWHEDQNQKAVVNRG